MSDPRASAGDPEIKRDFVSIQILRGCAAALVTYHHIFNNRIAAPWNRFGEIGPWGVDIFFVISGFIMWTATRPDATPATFLAKRVRRVFPLYWIVLTLWIGLRFVVPDGLHNADVDGRSVVLSYLLIPHFHLVYVGRVWPILPVGWTLQIEIFFYLVFAAALLVRHRAARFALVLAVLTALALAGLTTVQVRPALIVGTSPLLLEFAAGMGLAAGLGRVRALGRRAGIALVAAGVVGAALFCRIGMADDLRPFVLGFPALATVAGALALEGAMAGAAFRPLRRLGDASYSLYLVHPLAIAAAAVLWARVGLPAGSDPAAMLFVPVAAAAAIAAALLCHRYVEAPLLTAFPLDRRRSPAQAAAPMPAR